MGLGNLYKWLWSHTTGRPYTYIMRDFYHENPVLSILGEAWTVLIVNHYWVIHWYWWIGITIGILFGHLFWGSAYVPNEGEKSYKL
jgi:hypothetical protein